MQELVIRDIRQYGRDLSGNAKSLSIMFGVDRNFVSPMGLAMTSILEHNDNVSFHVFTDAYPSQEDDRCLSETMERYDSGCRMYLVDTSPLEGFPISAWTSAIYFRLMVEYFYGKLDRVLYLDGDVFCRGSLQELFSLDLQGNVVGAVEDVAEFPKKQREHFASLGLLGNAMYACTYFNSGMLLIDVNQWHALAVTDQAFSLLRSEPARWQKSPDQDLLNVLLQGRVCWLDARWDTMLPELQGTESDAVFVHFTGPKPWRAWEIGRRPGYDEEYQRMLQASAWTAVQPRNATECRLMARKCFRDGQIMEGLRWQMRYFKGKLFR